MATARILPSGRWRVRVYDYTDASGKNHYKSFTEDTKAKAELAASQYKNGDKKTRSKGNITVADALDRYISSREGVVSPSTIRGYRQMERNYYERIKPIQISKLTTEDMQKCVSGLSKKVGPKTVSNAYGLLVSSVTMFRPDAVFRVTMPKKVKKRKASPSDADIARLFSSAEGDLKLCIALAAFGSLRRGEICALKHGDVKGNSVYVHADMVQNETNAYEYKPIPKTSDSIRTVCLPDEVIAMMPRGKKDEFIVQKTPTAVTSAFMKLRDKLCLNICFHDLRHYYASVGAVLGVPDTYLSDFGGWRRGSNVMKSVYQNVMPSETQRFADVMNNHFGKLMRDTT